MRRFLYFFPGVSSVNTKMLATFGALDRFSASGGKTVNKACTTVNDGPAGAGCIVAAPDNAPDLRKVAWTQGERFWVGIEDLPPGPADLVRDMGLAGYETVLGDGSKWRVPLIRRWDADQLGHVPNVPTSLTMDKGKCVRKIRPEYSAVDAIAARTFAGFYAGGSFPIEALYADAAALLSVNYRIGIEEVNLLGLLKDEECLVHLLGLAIDAPGIERSRVAASAQGIYYSENEAALAEGAD